MAASGLVTCLMWRKDPTSTTTALKPDINNQGTSGTIVRCSITDARETVHKQRQWLPVRMLHLREMWHVGGIPSRIKSQQCLPLQTARELEQESARLRAAAADAQASVTSDAAAVRRALCLAVL